MTMLADTVSEETIVRFPTELQGSVRAINTPEVQEIMRQLGKYGLGVSLPHMHTDKGMAPLPEDMISSENNLVVSFRQVDDEANSKALPVAWRRGEDVKSIARCSDNCGACC